MSQIQSLLNLTPSVQEGILIGKIDLSEPRIRWLVASTEWDDSQ